MNGFLKICLLLLVGFFVICVCSFVAKAQRGGSNRPARWNYNLKQPKTDASKEWKTVAGKVWVCKSPFTVTGSGNIYYWRFFENQEGQYWSRVVYHIPRHSWKRKVKPEITVELEQIELDKHFIRKVNRSPRGITWGVLGDTLIVPAVVKAGPKKWVYSRFTRKGKHEEYSCEFENELKTGSSGRFKLTYEKKHGRAYPEVIKREDYKGQYTCAEIKGRAEIMVRFSDVRYVNKAAFSASFGSSAWYVNLESGVGFFDKGTQLKRIEKGWSLPEENYPDWRLFHKETETNKQILFKFLSDYEEKDTSKDSAAGKKEDEISTVEANIRYALVNAIDEGDITEDNIEEAKRLLTKGADINALSKRDGCTSLHYAAIRGQEKLTKFLLANSADINAKNIRGANALQGVAFIGNVDMARFLIKSGIEINNQGGFRNQTALHLAAGSGHRNIVELLIANDVNINAIDKNGWTPLRHASGNSNVELMKMLIDGGADINPMKGRNAWSPLSWAAEIGDYDLVKLLIAKGAGVNGIGEFGTSLNGAARNGHFTVAEFLISKGAEANIKGRFGRMPLHNAAIQGHLDIAKLLIANGVNVNAKDDEGKTAADYARKYKHKEIAELLHESGGIK